MRSPHENGIIFHTDAVQAYCHEPINVDEYHIDMLSASGHKFHGPKGVGFLYIRKGLKLRSFIHGGAQERKRRAGTENVPGIVGLGKAVEIAMAELENNKKKETELRDYLIGRVMDEIPYTRLNGSPHKPSLQQRELRVPSSSRVSPYSSCWTWTESAAPAAPHAHPVPWTRPMCS